MSYWIREVAGWLLVLLGLAIFFVVYVFCTSRMYFGGSILTVVGIFVFRGGIHLLKVAIAARVCMKTQELMYLRKSAEPVVSPRRDTTAR